MSNLFKELENTLPEDCKEAINSGAAEIVFKSRNFAIIDSAEVILFNCLPIISCKFGFCIVIPYNGKVSYTSFGEIVCRTRGILKFKNNFKCDYRRSNLEVTPWPLKVKK